MVVPVEEEEDVLPGGGGEEKDEKEDEEDEDYVPSTWDIRSRSRLSCKTTGRRIPTTSTTSKRLLAAGRYGDWRQL
jgi:hypothetical protein